MKTEIVEVGSADGLAGLRHEYLESLAAPFDGMWESFAADGHHLEFRSSSARAGFASIGERGRLLQFHVTERFVSETDHLFRAVVARDDVRGAMVSTADPPFLGPCLDHQRSVRVHTLLYRDRDGVRAGTEPEPPAALEVVDRDALDEIVAFQRASLENVPEGWLDGYLETRIGRGELYAFRIDGEVVATGEARVSDTQRPCADLGVITGRHHRRRGVGSRLLGSLRQVCRARGLAPICSTTVENLGARKAIARAGFVSRHRMLEVGF
jgi:GNAT superfamily N-acetyltransferase